MAGDGIEDNPSWEVEANRVFVGDQLETMAKGGLQAQRDEFRARQRERTRQRPRRMDRQRARTTQTGFDTGQMKSGLQ
ncbi:MAG TPA: hypothetical protein VEW42_03140 [Candidatus Eisenbacteria bacterium]|nr:hypothetical protein [Candidatus Eisenbacteria bacterium]